MILFLNEVNYYIDYKVYYIPESHDSNSRMCGIFSIQE